MWEVTLVIILCVVVSVLAYIRCSNKYHILVTKKQTEKRRNVYVYENEIGYLEHIVKKSLPDVIDFERGSGKGTLSRRESNYYFYSSTSLGYDRNHIDVPLKHDLGFIEWFRMYVSNTHDVESYVDVIQGSFSVKKDRIIKKPKEYYEKLLNSSYGGNIQEFEAYLKLSWYYIFN